MASFILRKVEDDKWTRFRERAQKEGHTLRWVILDLIAFYTRHGLPEPPKAKR
jgi:hypothetical protein